VSPTIISAVDFFTVLESTCNKWDTYIDDTYINKVGWSYWDELKGVGQLNAIEGVLIL